MNMLRVGQTKVFLLSNGVKIKGRVYSIYERGFIVEALGAGSYISIVESSLVAIIDTNYPSDVNGNHYG